jgi:hypothetical protein
MEEMLPPDSGTGAGFEKPTLRQFTIFLENRVGRLTLLLRCLEASGQRIVGIAIEESADAALVRLIPCEPEDTRQCLKESGFSFSITEVLAVELPQNAREPLISICNALLAAEINVHYAYPLLRGLHGPALALYVDDRTFAAQILIRKQFTLIGESDLRQC